MEYFQRNRKYTAALFQGIFIFYLLFTVFHDAKYPVLSSENSKTLFCVNSGSSLVARESSEQVSTALSYINNYGLDKLWRCAELLPSFELLTNVALRISSRAYNTFYILITIHAP